MVNILLPMGGATFFNLPEYPFPKPLIEIHNKPIIQLVIENLNRIKSEKNFIFIVNSEDCREFYIDKTINLLAGESCQIIKLTGETRGAACSVLMAIEHIDNELPLIIANSDQIFENDINQAIDYFQEENFDAGVVCFDSVHPRWSYVRTDQEGYIVESAEKRPISKNAIAGFYYFKHGRDFVRAAMQSIKKDNNVNGLYYIAPAIGELVLERKKLGVYKIDVEQYHTFYTPQKIKEYEQKG